MNNKVVVETFNIFKENNFSVCRFNFRGVGRSDGEFDNGQGELADAAAALDWLERENLDNSQCWVSGFSFGSLIAMQLLMRRPEINRFIAISPQPNVYDFSFLSPCPPELGSLHPVVSGNEIGKLRSDLIPKKAKACDSTKSPFKSKLSIIFIFLLIFFSIFLIKNLFFLPPPDT